MDNCDCIMGDRSADASNRASSNDLLRLQTELAASEFRVRIDVVFTLIHQVASNVQYKHFKTKWCSCRLLALKFLHNQL